MKITFNGAAKTVTGSSYLLETEKSKIIIDCGMFQGPKELRERNILDLNYDPKKIDAVLVTHAHIDHIGLLPKLVNLGFEKTIYCTKGTKDLAEIMLLDSAHIQAIDAEWENKKRVRRGLREIKPLYEKKDVDKTIQLLKSLEYHEYFYPAQDIRARYMDAGHILGSGFLELEVTEKEITKKIIFGGDLGRSEQAIIKNPEVTDDASVIVIESTYGNRLHKSDEDTEKEILYLINEVIRNRGTLIIPSFAVGRTQEMLYRFFELFEKNSIPEIDIFIDSPMSKAVTEVYAKNKELYDYRANEYLKRGKNPLEGKKFKFIETLEQSMELNKNNEPKVIISSSGMCDAGRILHHLKHHIWKNNTYVLFVGYQAEGTLGRRIIEGAKTVNILGDAVQVNAKVFTVGGLSAHADRDELISWLRFYADKKPQIFIVHGEPEVEDSFAYKIEEAFGLKASIPDWGDSVNIEFNTDGIETQLQRNVIQTKYTEEKNKWEGNIGKIGKFISLLSTENTGYEKKMVAETILNRLNSNIQEIIEEFRIE